MLSAKNSTPSSVPESGTKAAPYAVSTVGDMRVSFFSGRNLCSFSGDFSETARFHGCFSFLCIRSGSVMLENEDGILAVLTESSVAVIPPDYRYRVRKISGDAEGCMLFLTFERMKSVLHGQFSEYEYYSALFSAVDSIRVLDGEMLLALIENMGAVLRDWESSLEHIVQSYMSVFFIEVSGALAAGTVRPNGNAQRDDRFLHKTHRRWVIENYISNCYMNDNPTKELMQQLFLSKRQTDRVVEQIMGESLASLITKQRILMTEHFLQTTELTLQEISERVGYRSYSGFYTAVRKYRGETPEQLLKRCRGKKIKGRKSCLYGAPNGNRTHN